MERPKTSSLIGGEVPTITGVKSKKKVADVAGIFP